MKLVIFVLIGLNLGACTIIPRFNYDSIDVSNERDHLRELQASEKEPKVFDGELEPRMPDDDENDKTVAGIDSNNNGIRDDVEIYINRRFKEADFRRAYKQYAKSNQKWMLLGEQRADSATLKKFLATEQERANWCVLAGLYGYTSAEFTKKNITSDEVLSFLIGSSRKRKNAYQKAWESVGAGVLEFNDYSVEKACEFKLEKKWN